MVNTKNCSSYMKDYMSQNIMLKAVIESQRKHEDNKKETKDLQNLRKQNSISKSLHVNNYFKEK